MTCAVLFQIDVRLSVQYMSFSAHADAKGIMQLIRQVRSLKNGSTDTPGFSFDSALRAISSNDRETSVCMGLEQPHSRRPSK